MIKHATRTTSGCDLHSQSLVVCGGPAVVHHEVVPATATVAWSDLTGTEQTALKRLNRGPYPSLTEEMGARLVTLGFAVIRPDGIGISRLGRELVISTLLEARLVGDD